MIRTFLIGAIIGIAAALTALHYVPAVDQHREASIISVMPNGGNSETFHINVPMDRIMIGTPGRANPLPPGLKWPEDPLFEGVQSELFKLRNARDTVIGVAARMAVDDEETGPAIEWVLHLPARGSVFVRMDPEPVAGSRRVGEFSSGSREFGALVGLMSERWIADDSGSEDAPAGRIELVTQFVAEEDLSEDEGLVSVEAAIR